MTESQLERFIAKIQNFGEFGQCWIWTGAKLKGGYGRFTVGQRPTRSKLAHRLAYEHWVGDIPIGLDLDHLCRNRACVNPAHLEPVTHRENIRRGVGCHANVKIARQALLAQTHCRNGHSYENAYHQKGSRRCRTCQRAAMDRYRERLRKAAA